MKKAGTWSAGLVFKKLFLHTALLMVIFTGCQREEIILPVDGKITDVQPPLVSIQSPSTDMSLALNNESINISGIASDNKVLSSVSYVSDTRAGDVNGLENWLITDLPLNIGDNAVIVTAIDSASNKNSDSIIITRNRYLTFLNKPIAEPTAFYTKTATRVKINIPISPINNLVEGSVKLVEINEQNEVIREITLLHDDGDINHSDKIKGDWVYSIHNDFFESIAKKMRLRVIASTLEEGEEEVAMSAIFEIGIYEKLTNNNYQEIANFFDSLEFKLENELQDNDILSSMDMMEEWVIDHTMISSTEELTNGFVCNFKDGISGGVQFMQKNSDGELIYKGAKYGDERRSKKVIPLSMQTIGKSVESGVNILYDNLITNKKVFIWAPNEEDFSNDMAPTIIDHLDESNIDFSTDYLSNTNCTVSSFLSHDLTDYGLVVFDAHGTKSKYISTGETFDQQNFTEYSLLLSSNQIAIWQIFILDSDGQIEESRIVYYLSNELINSLPGKFPNTLIINGSCESTKYPDLSEAFFGKGASSYLGFNDMVTTAFCNKMTSDIIKGLVLDNVDLEDVYSNGQQDQTEPNAYFELIGNQAVHYTLTLINGDFEAGSMLGWNQEGDVRVISALGSINSKGGSSMAIISTGLGTYLEKSIMEQQFYIPANKSNLKISWNFFSEEFMEWLGEENQDNMKIVIVDKNGQKNELFSKNVDQFNSDYAMIQVSPEIVFDQGDVYSTDWQNENFDISNFAGSNITLRIELLDSGDGIFDSVVLLDDISID